VALGVAANSEFHSSRYGDNDSMSLISTTSVMQEKPGGEYMASE
jgi:hypothetical protein